MNQLNENNILEKVEKGSKVVIEQGSLNKAGSASSTTCVSPVLEGKSSTNNYIESLMLNSTLNPSIASSTGLGTNIGMGMNLGFGINMNLGGLTDLTSSNHYVIPSHFYQTSNFLGTLQNVIPDYYPALLRSYNLNNNIIPQSNIGITFGNAIPANNMTGVETMLNDQSALKFKEEKQNENSSLKLDTQSPILSSILQSPLLTMNSQPAIVSPSILPRISPIIGACTGAAYQIGSNFVTPPIINPMFINGSDNSEIANNSKKNSVEKDANSFEETDKLNSLFNSYLSNINNLTDTHERIRNYLNTNNFNKNLNVLADSLKLFGYINGMPDLTSVANISNINKFPNNVKSTNTSPRLNIANAPENNIPGEPNELFKLNHTRKYRLGDQGRALLKSELSAYLRNNPEKRTEASKIADIRNATTKQLWQIAAMCGLEERFINLHAQSLAQSKGKVNLRGTKRKSSVSNETSKTSRQGICSDSISRVKIKETVELNDTLKVDNEKDLNIYKDKNPVETSTVKDIEPKVQTLEVSDQDKALDETETYVTSSENITDEKIMNVFEENNYKNVSLIDEEKNSTLKDVSNLNVIKKMKL